MIKIIKIFPTALLTIIVFTSSIQLLAQDEKSNNPKIRSFGISMGIYNPELDYWKSDPNSYFTNSEYSTNILVKGFAEITLVKNLAVKAGVGYWQTRASQTIPSYGKTTMLLTGTPVSIDLVYYVTPAKIGFLTPYLGVGGELEFIQYSLDFADKTNPDPVNGSSFLGTGLIGLQSKLSKNFSLDLFLEYKLGSYEQDFIREIQNPDDPNAPTSKVLVTEDISLSGPQYGISFKYLF